MIALKEWYYVCQAIKQKKQHILLRKGGIHDSKKGFRFRFTSFYLFPTLFHLDNEMIKAAYWQGNSLSTAMPQSYQVGDNITIDTKIQLTKTATITTEKQLQQLTDQHIFSDDFIRSRFHEEGAGGRINQCIECAWFTTEILTQPLQISYQKNYGGCRSWLQLKGML